MVDWSKVEVLNFTLPFYLHNDTSLVFHSHYNYSKGIFPDMRKKTGQMDEYVALLALYKQHMWFDWRRVEVLHFPPPL